MQIADAALLAGAQHPSLHIRSPFQLSERQLRAALKLLERQKALSPSRWGAASDQVERVRERRGDDRRRLVVRRARAAQAGRPRALARSRSRVRRRGSTRGRSSRPRRTPAAPTGSSTTRRRRRCRRRRRGSSARRRPRRAPAACSGSRRAARSATCRVRDLRAPALPHDAGHVVPRRPALHERRALERRLGTGSGADASPRRSARAQPRRRRARDSRRGGR